MVMNNNTASRSLKKFSADQLVLTEDETRSVLKFFFPSQSPPKSINNEFREFAQALLIEAIEESYAMGFVEVLLRTYFGGISNGFNIAAFIRKAVRGCWSNMEILAKPEKARIYESVRRTIALNFGRVYLIMKNEME